jgi:hypothetical protein
MKVLPKSIALAASQSGLQMRMENIPMFSCKVILNPAEIGWVSAPPLREDKST